MIVYAVLYYYYLENILTLCSNNRIFLYLQYIVLYMDLFMTDENIFAIIAKRSWHFIAVKIASPKNSGR